MSFFETSQVYELGPYDLLACTDKCPPHDYVFGFNPLQYPALGSKIGGPRRSEAPVANISQGSVDSNSGKQVNGIDNKYENNNHFNPSIISRSPGKVFVKDYKDKTSLYNKSSQYKNGNDSSKRAYSPIPSPGRTLTFKTPSQVPLNKYDIPQIVGSISSNPEFIIDNSLYDHKYSGYDGFKSSLYSSNNDKINNVDQLTKLASDSENEKRFDPALLQSKNLLSSKKDFFNLSVFTSGSVPNNVTNDHVNDRYMKFTDTSYSDFKSNNNKRDVESPLLEKLSSLYSNSYDDMQNNNSRNNSTIKSSKLNSNFSNYGSNYKFNNPLDAYKAQRHEKMGSNKDNNKNFNYNSINANDSNYGKYDTDNSYLSSYNDNSSLNYNNKSTQPPISPYKLKSNFTPMNKSNNNSKFSNIY